MEQAGSYDAAAISALQRDGIISRMRIYSALRFHAPVPSLPVITARRRGFRMRRHHCSLTGP